MKVNVFGLEGSGNNWTAAILRQHPELEVSVTSYPGNGFPDRLYPDLPQSDVNVICGRDQTCHQNSVKRRGFNKGYRNDQFTDAQNIEALWREASKNLNTRLLFFSYETALVYRHRYLDWFFKLLDVAPMEPQVEWNDGNVKYVRRLK